MLAEMVQSPLQKRKGHKAKPAHPAGKAIAHQKAKNWKFQCDESPGAEAEVIHVVASEQKPVPGGIGMEEVCPCRGSPELADLYFTNDTYQDSSKAQLKSQDEHTSPDLSILQTAADGFLHV